MKIITLAVLSCLLTSTAVAEESPWPRTFESNDLLITMYTPEVASVRDMDVQARGAFSIARGESHMVFGAVSFTATFEQATPPELTLKSVQIEAIRLPDSLMQHQDTVIALLREAVMSWDIRTTKSELSKWENGPGSSGIVATDLKNEPPTIIVRERPSLLVVLDGEPSLKPIENSSYQYVENTATPLIYDTSSRTYYLPNGSDWYAATDLMGSWSMTSNVPSDVRKMVKLEDNAEVKTTPNLDVVVVTKPTELIAFSGEPEWKPLVGTDLLYASNTESSVFKDVGSGTTYVLLSGRWFSAATLRGAWTFVEPTALPAVFKEIPEGGAKADVRTAVAGTIEAEEAVLDAYVPTAAAVDRKTASIEVVYNGDPIFTKISGTSMEYAVNTTTPVVKTNGRFYAVEDGVWYVSTTATGPWTVSDQRPDEVENIPSSSPVSNIKYVYVYSSTPSVVYVGYTPGYYGTYVYGPTVVYGTGWYYNPWYGPHYYPRPVTYGYHVHYNPYHGWSYGFSYSSGWFHMSVGFRPPYYHHYHPAYYRPPYYHRPAYRPPAYRPPSYRPPAGSRPPTNRPTARPSTRPSTRPATTPTARPSTRPTTRPSPSPSTRPAYTPTARPSTYSRPSTSNRVPRNSVQHPTSRPSNRSAFRPSTTSRPAPRGGGGRRR